MLAPDKMSHLLSTKEEKINTLSEKTYSNQDLTRESYTDLGDGYVENNGNKIWGISEDWTPQEMAFARDYLTQNYAMPSEARGDRRFYEYGVKDEGKIIDPESPYQPENYDPRKIGLASGRYNSSDRRYTPDGEYGWESGTSGVDVNRNYEDTNLAYGAATALEALVHSNRSNFDNRLVRERGDGLYDYNSPTGLRTITKEEKDKLFNSGASEYYLNHNSVFDDAYNPEEIDQAKIIEGLNKAMSIVAGDKYEVPLTNAEEAARIGEIADKYTSVGERFGNMLKGFGATFVDSLLVSPADAIGDLTGWYDIGSDEENTAAVNNLFGYDPRFQQRAMERIGTQWEKLADSNASIAERMRAAGNGILEAFLAPEMLGTSFGALASWMTPGALLKVVGVGSKYAQSVKAIDAAVEAGTMTKAAARAAKAKELFSIPGAKAALANQSGFMVSAMGEVNKQYNQFVANNNDVELEGAEKAKWFAGRFAVQMVNQNIDKFVDFSILKNPGMIAAAIPAVKAMTNKEFANVAKIMGTGVLVTGQNMGKEAAQEYSQTMMELFNSRYGSKKFEDVEQFKAFLADERNTTEAGIAALAGAGGASQFEAVGTILPATSEVSKLGGKLGESIKKQAKTTTTTVDPVIPDSPVTEEELTLEEVAQRETDAYNEADSTVTKFSAMLDDKEFTKLFAAETTEEEEVVATPKLKESLAANPDQYKSSFNEIEKAEAVINERVEAGKSKDTDEVALKVLRKAKRELILNSMEDENQPTLGSGYAPEDVVEAFLDAADVVDGKLDITSAEEKVLNKFVEDNDIPPLRFQNLRKFRTGEKDASEVQEEAVGSGERSVSSYAKRLGTLVNSANPSRTAISKVIGSLDNFLSSQENRKAARDAVTKELEANIKNYNNQINSKKSIPASVKKKLLQGKDVPGYEGAFVAVTEASNGTLVIHPESQAVDKSIQDNIDYIKRVKTRYGSKVKNIMGEEFTGSDSGISVRPNSKVQDARDKDQKFYNKRGVTKAIVDSKSSPQWSAGGDYVNDNNSIVNTGDYTSDDVVVVNSTAAGFKKGSKFRAEIAKAFKAGATIVIDREVATDPKNKVANAKLTRLLQQYHFRKVEEDGVIKFVPEAKAKPIRDKQAAKKKQERTKARSLRKLIQAVESNNQDAVKEVVDELFNGDEKKALAYYENQVNKQTEELTNKLLDIALTKGFQSAELNEAMAALSNAVKKGNRPNAAVEAAFEAVNQKIAELEKGETLLSDWNEAQKQAKKGKLDFAAWIKENVTNPMAVVKEMFKTAVGEGKKVAYVYYDKAAGDFKGLTTSLEKIPKGVPYQVIELDPNRYATVSKTTPLNSFNPKELRIAGQENIAFNQLVDTAVGTLKATLRAPDLDYNNTKNSIIDISNSPAATLIFNKDLKVNETVAIAMQLGLNNFVKNSGYLLKKGKKSKSDIAEILGIDESQVSRAAVEMMSDKGLLYKTVSNSIGKDIASMLGLSRKSDSEADVQAYDALVADLGQTAILMGVKHKENPNGFLEVDNTLPSAKFAVTVLGKSAKTVDDGNNSKVLFIQAINKSEDLLEIISEQAKIISESIPDIDAGRKEPSFKKIDSKIKKKVVSKIRKEKLGLKVPGNSQKALNELMDTEWSADLTLMQEMLDNADLIKARLGYIAIDPESAEYQNLSFEEKEVQESINRGLDRSFEEMQWLIDSNPDSESVSMWFEYFFSKNGRFFIDSNTINPQTDKHLHRFAVQPKSHINTFVFGKDKKFKVNGKDVTNNVYYAIAQGFGFATDKKDTAKIKEFAELVITKLGTPAAIAEAKKNLLETGKHVLTDKVDEKGNPVDVIEIEHLGHALQTFKFLEQKVTSKGKPFNSAITAEFDAVTSGFGLKNLQMPIISDRENWLKKVGVLLNSDEVLTDDQVVSMNDILDSGKVLDSYQTLASDVQQLSFEEMQKELPKITVVADTPYSKNLWQTLSEVLPQVEEGKVSGALRTLFKYPFMTFNYSASIKSIRSNLLTGELLTGLAKEMAAADIKDKDASIVKLMQAFVGKNGDVAKLQNDVRTKPLYQIKSGEVNSNLEQHLGQMIEASYGAQVEKILTEQFKDFVEAQKNVNAAFTAMFEIFAVSFEKALIEERKKGPLSEAREKEIYRELKNQWPMIKGPLSEMEQEVAEGDGVGIYDTQTSSPYGPYSGRKPSRALISKSLGEKLGKNGKPQKDIRVSQMVKNLTAAIAAGSVVPIHYIDGAIMAQTINGLAQSGIKGITSIHDAIMPSLVQMDAAQREYNKQTLEVNASYSFINEIMNTLDRFLDKVPLNDEGYKTRKIKVTTEEGEVEMPVKEFLLKARNDFMTLANKVKEGRESLYNMLNQGAKIMHMAGTPDGVYNVEAGSVTYKPVEKVGFRKYTTTKVNNKTIVELQAVAKDLNCKGS